MPGNPSAVRVGPGWLYIAALGTPEPASLADAWDAAWVGVGYTDEGSNFVFNNTFENVEVAEEYEPVAVLQTTRQIDVSFAAAEMTALNLQRAFNGGTVVTAGGVVTFEPQAAGLATPVMLGWEATDGLERWIFRRCLQVANVDIPRRRAPDKSVLPMTFRCMKPASATAFKAIFDEDYVGS